MVYFTRQGYTERKYVEGVVLQVLPLCHFPTFRGALELHHSHSHEGD